MTPPPLYKTYKKTDVFFRKTSLSKYNFKHPAFGVNFTGITQMVIWQIPSNLEVTSNKDYERINSICFSQVFMQMVGRCARQEGEEANVYVFVTAKLYHFYINKMNVAPDQEAANLEKNSVTWLYNALMPGKCTWKHLLSYFKEHVNDSWTCQTKCAHCAGDGTSLNNEIYEHPSLQTALKTIKMVPTLNKTTLYFLLLSTPSALDKVPKEVQDIFSSCKDRRFKPLLHITKATEFTTSMQDAGLVQLHIVRNSKSSVLRLTEKGLSTIEDVPNNDDTVQRQDNCELPSLEMMKACPIPSSEFVTPNQEDLQKIHEAEEMTDELFEICMRIPVIKGHIVLDIKEENRTLCVPKAIIEEIFCKEHKTYKEGYPAALVPFHRYPNYISWGVATRWKKKTFEHNLLGLTIRWICSHRTYCCAAQKMWKTIGEAEHNGEIHIIIEETFETIGIDKEIQLNRHIHPCGSKLQNRKTVNPKVSLKRCCVFNRSVMSADYQNVGNNEENFPQKTVSQPVFSFMQQLFEDYSADPIKAQLNSATTYGRTRNIQHSIAVANRPWLGASANEASMSRFNRVQLLKEYIDKKECKQGNDPCPSYIGPITDVAKDVFTVICTDLFGVSLYHLATRKKACVISIDGTGKKIKQCYFNHRPHPLPTKKQKKPFLSALSALIRQNLEFLR